MRRHILRPRTASFRRNSPWKLLPPPDEQVAPADASDLLFPELDGATPDGTETFQADEPEGEVQAIDPVEPTGLPGEVESVPANNRPRGRIRSVFGGLLQVAGAVSILVFVPAFVPLGPSEVTPAGPLVVGNPYDLPFVIRNRNWFFSIDTVTIACRIRGQFEGNVKISLNKMFDEGSVPPNTAVPLGCRFTEGFNLHGREIVEGRLAIDMAVRHGWRQLHRWVFRWDPTTQQWLQTDKRSDYWPEIPDEDL